jgi:drug/metabolite transporter (DMT)-like permease
MLSLFFKNQKIDRKDWPRILLCSFLGMVINMLSFFKGLELSTPINSSVLITVVPILVFSFSIIILKEKVTLIKILGIFAGFFGALVLILYSPVSGYNAPNIPLGNLLFVLNSSTYGLYLIFVKPLVEKNIILLYFLDGCFLFGFIMNFPITVQEFSAVDWVNLPLKEAVIPMIYVVVGTTFFTYLLNAYALSTLKASTVSSFVYFQPIVGIVYALTTKNDSLTLINIIGMLLIFTGVYLVTKKIESNI